MQWQVSWTCTEGSIEYLISLSLKVCFVKLKLRASLSNINKLFAIKSIHTGHHRKFIRWKVRSDASLPSQHSLSPNYGALATTIYWQDKRVGHNRLPVYLSYATCVRRKTKVGIVVQMVSVKTRVAGVAIKYHSIETLLPYIVTWQQQARSFFSNFNLYKSAM